jgi:uncharacterized protein YndB with AHSA1/START domain
MESKNQVQIKKDLANKKITITRNFDASPEEVWDTWTKDELLVQWWAPKPWHAETKSFDFKAGGHWLYAMVGPENEKHWARIDYKSVNPKKNFEAKDCFCDENGNANADMPSMHWKNSFDADGAGTKVTVEITFASESDMNQLLTMGFEEGFTAALGNLDEVLSKSNKFAKS